ncbi:tyrosine-type recombinase/integrase [Flavisolibacter sp. BT320]|nr:tyrosine-type recombinase/integrase [Flavisolibacter longurius]
MKKTASVLLSLLPEFAKFIAASKRGKRAKYAGRKLAPGTIEQYECVRKLLKEFESRQQITIRIVLLKKQSLSLLKKEQLYWRRFFAAFTSFLYQEKRCYDCYVSSVSKTLKAFFNYLIEEKHLPVGTFHQQFRVAHQTFTPLVLEPAKLRQLISDKAFEASLPHALQRTKDLFVFGCTVALRYSDLMSLRKKHLVEAPEGKYLLIHTKKTSTLVKLPLPDYLVQILKKYKGKTGGYLLPRLSSTNLNLQVKELCQKAGWNYLLPKVRYRRGKPVEIKNKERECLRFYEQVSTHTMRRTAITTLLIMGVPEQVVRRISGHTAHSKEFYRYVVVAQDYLNKHVLEAFEKLMAQETITNAFKKQ